MSTQSEYFTLSSAAECDVYFVWDREGWFSQNLLIPAAVYNIPWKVVETESGNCSRPFFTASISVESSTKAKKWYNISYFYAETYTDNYNGDISRRIYCCWE